MKTGQRGGVPPFAPLMTRSKPVILPPTGWGRACPSFYTPTPLVYVKLLDSGTNAPYVVSAIKFHYINSCIGFTEVDKGVERFDGQCFSFFQSISTHDSVFISVTGSVDVISGHSVKI